MLDFDGHKILFEYEDLDGIENIHPYKYNEKDSYDYNGFIGFKETDLDIIKYYQNIINKFINQFR